MSIKSSLATLWSFTYLVLINEHFFHDWLNHENEIRNESTQLNMLCGAKNLFSIIKFIKRFEHELKRCTHIQLVLKKNGSVDAHLHYDSIANFTKKLITLKTVEQKCLVNAQLFGCVTKLIHNEREKKHVMKSNQCSNWKCVENFRSSSSEFESGCAYLFRSV